MRRGDFNLLVDDTEGVVDEMEIHLECLLAVVDGLIEVQPSTSRAVDFRSTDVPVTDLRYGCPP